MGKHTPQSFDQPMPLDETWTQCPNNGYDILIANGDYVGAFVHDDTHAKFSRSRCERAVACVNALAGIPDPAAYVRAVELARENVQKAVDLIRYVNAESAHENFQLNEAIGLLKSILAWDALRTLSTPESEENK